MMRRRELPDLRFVYRNWDGPLRARGYRDTPLCRRHRWTIIDPQVLRATRGAGLSSHPTWYCGPTDDPYCEQCGVYCDQDTARRMRWEVLKVFAQIDDRLKRQVSMLDHDDS